MNTDRLYHLMEMACGKLEEIERDGFGSTAAIDLAQELSCICKNLSTVIAMEERTDERSREMYGRNDSGRTSSRHSRYGTSERRYSLADELSDMTSDERRELRRALENMR